MKVLVMVLLTAQIVSAQGLIEIRGAQTQYRYLDLAYTSKKGILGEVFYIGVPGANDLNAGTGYSLKRSEKLNLTPAVYYVATKEGDRGMKLGLTFSVAYHNWKASGFLAKHWSMKNFSSYSFADPVELTRSLKRFELGASAGFMHQDRKWNPLYGPVVRFNDKAGAWSLSVRSGSQTEIRMNRTFNF